MHSNIQISWCSSICMIKPFQSLRKHFGFQRQEVHQCTSKITGEILKKQHWKMKGKKIRIPLVSPSIFASHNPSHSNFPISSSQQSHFPPPPQPKQLQGSAAETKFSELEIPSSCWIQLFSAPKMLNACFSQLKNFRSFSRLMFGEGIGTLGSYVRVDWFWFMTSELHERFLSKHWSEDQESTSRNWRERMSQWKTVQNREIFTFTPGGVGPSKNTLSLEPSCKRILSTSMDESRAFSSASVFAWLFRCFPCGSRCPRGRFLPGCIGGTQNAVYLPSFILRPFTPKQTHISHHFSYIDHILQ